MKQAIKQNALFVWGFFSMLLLAGDSDTMSIGQFFLIKAIAVASLLLCACIGYQQQNRQKTKQ